MWIDRARLRTAAEAFVETPRPDATVREHRRRAAASPHDTRVAIRLAELETRAGLDEDAIATYERAGRTLASQGFVARAIYAFEQAGHLVRRGGRDALARWAPIFCRLAEAHLARGDHGRALQTIQELAAACRASELPAAEVQALRQLVALAPQSTAARAQLVEALLRAGDTDEAVLQVDWLARAYAAAGDGASAARAQRLLAVLVAEVEVEAEVEAEVVRDTVPPVSGVRARQPTLLGGFAGPGAY